MSLDFEERISCADSWSVQLLDYLALAGLSCADSQSVQLLGNPCADSQSVQLLEVQTSDLSAWGIAMFAGQHSDISHRKSVDISVWPQKEGKTVWILDEQQYFWECCPLLQGRDSGFV